MRVLIACESSGVVRDAFRARGHDAWSCDLLPCESPNHQGNQWHFQADIKDIVLNRGIWWRGKWDLMIAHPPCTYLCSSGLHWNKRRPGRADKTEDSLAFVRFLMDLPIKKIAIENPVGCIGTRIRKADQYVQPFEYGHPESKRTGLWLKNLPLLQPTKILPLPACGYWENQTPSRQNKLGPSAYRWQARAKTYTGIANAMADQWGIAAYDAAHKQEPTNAKA